MLDCMRSILAGVFYFAIMRCLRCIIIGVKGMSRLLKGLIVLCAAMMCLLPVGAAAGYREQVMEYFSYDTKAKELLCQTLTDRLRDKKGVAGGHFVMLRDEGSMNGNADKEDVMRIVHILRQLGMMAGTGTDSWAVIVQESNRINAFALPEYIFVVSTEALQLLNDDELEVLLAHELGHQVLRHPSKSMKLSSLSQGKLHKAYRCMENGNIEEAAKYYAEAMELAVASKVQEKQADIWAAELLRKHGRDMQTAVDLWQRLEMLYGKVSNDSNHLSYRERQRIYMSYSG